MEQEVSKLKPNLSETWMKIVSIYCHLIFFLHRNGKYFISVLDRGEEAGKKK